MSDFIEAYDVMKYERKVTEFLREYHDNNEIVESPIGSALKATRKAIDYFFRRGDLEFTSPVMNITIFGRVIERTEALPVVSPDGEKLDTGPEKVFAERLLKEENPWETLYELEVADDCKLAGLNPKLVHEGSSSGPDILVETNNEVVDIECKRRRPQKNHEEDGFANLITKEVRDRINPNSNDIPEESFFIELTGEGPLKEEAVDSIIELTVDAIENRKSNINRKIGGVHYHVRLREYFSGEKMTDITKSDMRRLFKFLNPGFVRMFLSPFDSYAVSPGMVINAPIKFTSDGRSVTKGVQVINFNFPSIDEGHYAKIVGNTIKRGRKDLSGRSPAVLYVFLPADEFEDMTRYIIPGHKDEEILQIKRLEQRIRGQLNDSSSLNAIVLTSKYLYNETNKAQIQRVYKAFENENPKSPLPDRFERFVEGNLFE